jgi:hypothetical protein
MSISLDFTKKMSLKDFVNTCKKARKDEENITYFLYPIGTRRDGSTILGLDKEAMEKKEPLERDAYAFNISMVKVSGRTYQPYVTFFDGSHVFCSAYAELSFGDSSYGDARVGQNQTNCAYYGWDLVFTQKTYSSAGSYSVQLSDGYVYAGVHGWFYFNDLIWSTFTVNVT